MIFWISLAGGLGAGARFVVDGALTQWLRTTWAAGTLVVNVVGSFLLGMIAAWMAGGGPPAVHQVLGVGFIGGFTTFSTASVEVARLFRDGRRGAAASLAAAMLLVSLLAALGGWLLVGDQFTA